MPNVEVRSHIVGAPQADTPPPVAFELLHETLTAAELITHAVEEQLRDLLITRQMNAEAAQRVLQRQYLTDADIRAQAESGAVRFPGEGEVYIPQLDAQAEARKAHRAFEARAFLMVVDGEQIDALDTVITLKPTSAVTFVRLTPLVGG